MVWRSITVRSSRTGSGAGRPSSAASSRSAARAPLWRSGFRPIMKEMLARFGSAADGATINRLAREVLAKPAG